MELSDKIIAVRKMKKYIDIHFDDEITLEDLSRVASYSKYHTVRIFKELTGRTPFEAIRALRLTKAAFDYNKPIPPGYEIAELSPYTYLYFIGMPFDDPNDFHMAIGILNEAIKAYPFEHFGWKRSDSAPYLGMGAEAETGARAAVPVEKI